MSYFLTNNSNVELTGELSSNPKIIYRITEHNYFNKTAFLEQRNKEFVVKKASIKQVMAQLGNPNENIYLKSDTHKYSIYIKDHTSNLTIEEILQVLEEANLIKPID